MIMTKKNPFPVFNRKLESWASFRRVFREMVKESRHAGTGAGDGKAQERSSGEGLGALVRCHGAGRSMGKA